MKKILILALAAALSACAVQQPAPYAARAYPAPSDPAQWRVVSVTPVAPGTGERMAASGGASRVEADGSTSYVSQSSSQPITQPAYVAQPVYAQAPVYVGQPVYPGVVVAAPVYAAPPPSYYYPPVALSFGLGLVFGSHWSHGGYRYRHR